MGVKELWPLLTSVMKKKSFEDISGQTVAIDLSLWIVDSQCVKQMVGTVTRPHLRNIFFRTVALLQAGILPVFVVDGKAPELKWQTMADRQKYRQGKPGRGQTDKLSARRANRSHFNTVIKECCEMLRYLGVPVIEAVGEAEAMCAALNSQRLVDAVITDDGDAFLYGALTVYRNFTITKSPSVESYCMADIESSLGLSRNHLISLALLIGCDYCPKGVPGVGKGQAIKFCSEVGADVILSKMLRWSSQGMSATESTTEVFVARKICNMKDNNFLKISEEFKNASCKVPASVGSWKKPLISKSQDFHSTKMDWPINYSLEKMLPLLTLWSFNCVSRQGASADSLTIQPDRIVKERVRQGVDCLEVLWSVADPYQIDEEDEKAAQLVTIESLQIMEKCFPSDVQEFLSSKTSNKAKTVKRTTKESNAEQLSKASAQYTCTLQPMSHSAQHTRTLQPVSHSAQYTRTLQPVSHSAQYTRTLQPVSHSLDKKDVLSLSDLSASFNDSAADDQSLESSGAVCSDNGAFANLSYSDQENLSPNSDFLEESFDLSMLSIDSPRCKAPEGTNTASKHSLRRNSIDELLADISGHLKTPARTKCKSLPSINDSIITGHVTPESSFKQSANFSCLKLSSDENTGINLTDSELSLLSMGSLESPSPPPTSSEEYCGQSVTGSTPLDVGQCVTYGEFDLVSQLSFLSFTE